MFITSENYVEQISKVVEESKSLSVAVAFWGKSSESVFKSKKELPIRIICNLMSGGTNPEPIRILRDTPGVEIRQMNDLHAKVIVGEKHAIVGSANFSTNGLRLEDAQESGWKEAGILTTDAVEISSIQSWFDSLWPLSGVIEDKHLKQAEEIWNTGDTPPPAPPWNPSISLMKTPLAELKGEPIYITVWRELPSPQAESAFEKAKSELVISSNGRLSSLLAESLSFYEDWGNLPENASLISIQYGLDGKINVGGSWRRILEDIPFFDEKHVKKFFQMAVLEKHVQKKSFSKTDQKELGRLLKPYIAEIWERIENHGCVESLYDVRKMIAKDLESRGLE